MIDPDCGLISIPLPSGVTLLLTPESLPVVAQAEPGDVRLPNGAWMRFTQAAIDAVKDEIARSYVANAPAVALPAEVVQ